MPFEEHLKSALRAVEAAFLPDELAYLALTQKVEHAFRDKLAFVLHRRMQEIEPNFVVCREWKRADLAILEAGAPLLIVEAKAGYSFDIIKGKAGYDFPRLVMEDLGKAAKLATRFNQSTPEIYALVIATHPHAAPAPQFVGAVKYYRSVTQYATERNNLVALRERMRERMHEFDLVDMHNLGGGQAFGVEVSIFVWLYRAKVVENMISSE